MYHEHDYEADICYAEEVFKRFMRNAPISILDIGCGTGTHALEFAKRGYEVTGIDISAEQIRIARKKIPSQFQNSVRFVESDMRHLHLNRKFDAAVSFFGSMGYNETDEDLKETLSGIRDHLKVGGLLLFEFWNVRGARGGHRTSWHRVAKDDFTIIRLDESIFDTSTSILKFTFDGYVLKDKQLVDRFTEQHSLRVFSPREVRFWLEACGFKPKGIFEERSFDAPTDQTFRATAIALAK